MTLVALASSPSRMLRKLKRRFDHGKGQRSLDKVVDWSVLVRSLKADKGEAAAIRAHQAAEIVVGMAAHGPGDDVKIEMIGTGGDELGIDGKLDRAIGVKVAEVRETGENVIEAIEGIVIEVIVIEAIEVEVIAAIEGIEAIEAIAIVEIVAESVTIEEMRDEDEMTEMKVIHGIHELKKASANAVLGHRMDCPGKVKPSAQPEMHMRMHTSVCKMHARKQIRQRPH